LLPLGFVLGRIEFNALLNPDPSIDSNFNTTKTNIE